jgi:exodeoxyribonuclease-3
MIFSTFNVNSINKRKDLVQKWAKSNNIDFLALQELKTLNPPLLDNYECFYSSQKQFNGVMSCSIFEFEKSSVLEPARAIYTKTNDINIINIYAPLGDLYSEKFEYKIQFYKNLMNFINKFDLKNEKLILMGDFNIIHKEIDVFDAKKWEGHVTFLPEEREIFNQLLSLGLYDSFRELYPTKQQFSFYDYRDKYFKRGLRLDYMLVTKPVLNKINDIYIDFTPRTLPSPSDHTPLVMELNC